MKNQKPDIKRCCASCEHKEIDENGKRTCRLKAMRVERRYRCPRWQMTEGLEQLQARFEKNNVARATNY